MVNGFSLLFGLLTILWAIALIGFMILIFNYSGRASLRRCEKFAEKNVLDLKYEFRDVVGRYFKQITFLRCGKKSSYCSALKRDVKDEAVYFLRHDYDTGSYQIVFPIFIILFSLRVSSPEKCLTYC